MKIKYPRRGRDVEPEQNVPMKPPDRKGNENEPEKNVPKKRWNWKKFCALPIFKAKLWQNICSVIFQIIVFAIVTYALMRLKGINSLDKIGQNPIFPIYLIFASGCAASIFYSLATGKSTLGVANKALWAVIAVSIGVIFFWPKPSNAADHQSASSSAYAAQINYSGPRNYNDADTTFKDTGTYWFNLTDSGQTTSAFGAKKSVRKWHFDLSQCLSYKFLVILTDVNPAIDRADTIRVWESGYQEIWGKKMCLESLEKIGKVGVIFD